MLQTYNDSSNEWEYDMPFDVNLQDTNCQTPLFIACSSEQMKFVEFLLEFTVDARPCGADKNNAQGGVVVDEVGTETYEDVIHAVAEDEAATTGSTSVMETSTLIDGFGTLKKARSKLNASKIVKNLSAKQLKRIKPVTLNVYNAKGYTPLHVAVMKSNKPLVKLLVESGADLNLPLALTEDDLVRLQMEEVQICGSGALIEACRNGDVDLVEYLLEKGAVDHDNKALAVCVGHESDVLTCKLLSRHVFNDPEFRINKKCVDLDPALHLSKGRTVVPSSLFPSCAVVLNWHSASLRRLKSDWLLSAALQLNPKLAGSPPSVIVTAAITRIDVAKNQLDELPLCVFQLPSLRILNAAHNKLTSLPSPPVESSTPSPKTSSSSSSSSAVVWNVPVLEEIHIEHNKLESLPSILFDLINLQGLDVSNNNLVSLPPNMWTAPKLKDLNASFNQLKSLPYVSLDYSFGSAGRRGTSSSVDHNDIDVSVSSSAADDSSSSVPLASPSASFKSNDATTSATYDDSDEHASVDSFRFGRTDDSLSYQELKRHNLWQKSLELSKLCDDEIMSNAKNGAVSNKSSLTSLNICHNLFDRIPEGLPCVAPSLSRLNISHNKLTEIGPVNAYPPRLKHLDLANNRIKSWFGSSTGGYCMCGSLSSTSQRPVSPVSSKFSFENFCECFVETTFLRFIRSKVSFGC